MRCAFVVKFGLFRFVVVLGLMLAFRFTFVQLNQLAQINFLRALLAVSRRYQLLKNLLLFSRVFLCRCGVVPFLFGRRRSCTNSKL